MAGLVADGETSLNDGVLEALRTLGGHGTRRVILLTDGGADSTSHASLASAVMSLRSSGAQLTAVQLGHDTASNAALRQLTHARAVTNFF